MQLLRTYPDLRLGRDYPFADGGERSVARGYSKAIAKAERIVYVEDQYFWGHGVAEPFETSLRENPGLHVVVVIPLVPDIPGWNRVPQLFGRERALLRLMDIAPDRVAAYGIENHAGTPVYVHAKVCVIDDVWASTGCDNFNRRSWTHDSELSAVVLDEDYARDLRLTLAAEHLDRLDEVAERGLPGRWTTASTRRACTPPTRPPRPGSRSGTAAGAWGSDRRADCVRCPCPVSRGSPGRGRGSRSRRCTTPTGGRRRSGGPRSTDGPTARSVVPQQVLSIADPRSLSAVRSDCSVGTTALTVAAVGSATAASSLVLNAVEAVSTASSCALNSLLAELLTCAKSCLTAANLVCSSLRAPCSSFTSVSAETDFFSDAASEQTAGVSFPLQPESTSSASTTAASHRGGHGESLSLPCAPCSSRDGARCLLRRG